MKNRYRMGLFYCLCFAIFVLILLVLSVIVQREKEKNELNQMTKNESFLETQCSQIRTNCDTIFIEQILDAKHNLINEKQYSVPAYLIGMNREELSDFFAQESNNKEYISKKIIVFSHTKVWIQTMMDDVLEKQEFNEKKTLYYLIEKENKLVVCYPDKDTVYYETEILYSDLPKAVQEDIEKGKVFQTELEVMQFIETYTS